MCSFLHFSPSTCFDTSSWNFAWLYFTVLQIKTKCCQFPSIFVGVMPLLEWRILKIQFSALFSYTLRHIELKFCIRLCLNVPQIKFECRQFPSIFYTPVFRRDVLWYGDVCPSVRPGLRPSDSPSVHPSGSPSASFPHFSPTCFDILSWHFAHNFVLLYYRSSSSVVNLRQVLWELCPFWNLKYWK